MEDLSACLPRAGTAALCLADGSDRLVWCYRNVSSVWRERLLSDHCATEVAEQVGDPLMNLTSGCLLEGDGLVRDGNRSLRLRSRGSRFSFSVHVLSVQTPDLDGWFSAMSALFSRNRRLTPATVFFAHKQWWRDFWNRSHIHVKSCGDSPVALEHEKYAIPRQAPGDSRPSPVVDSRENAYTITQGYALERFTQACASRGQVPLLWNGSIFTMDMPAGTHFFYDPAGSPALSADSRCWDGLCFLWQNTRHPCWSMLARGDYDLMLPAFKLALGTLEVAKARCRGQYGHEGAYLAEWFLWKGPAGGALEHLRYHFIASLEIAVMMCDYYLHTADRKFAQEFLMPITDEVVKFFELHFAGRDESGRMRMEPAGLAEIYQPVSNPATEVSGLRSLLNRLSALDGTIAGQDRKARWAKLLNILPETPVRRIKGLSLLGLADRFLDNYPSHLCWGPDQWCRFADSTERRLHRNAGGVIFETPELYAVFPFRQASWADSVSLSRARQSYHVRQLSLDGTPDYFVTETSGMIASSTWAACLGLAREAARLTSINFNDRIPDFSPKGLLPAKPDYLRPRFPGFWEGFSIIDCDHGGASANGLQHMLLQREGETLYLLPAWPEDWDVSFKLRAPRRTTVECVYRNGRVRSLKVTPASRQSDIVDMSSPAHRIRTMVDVACADRNRLFGLPPMLDGQACPADVKRLKTTGPWLARYGESLYGTTGGPFDAGTWGGSTCKGSVVYLHILNEPDNTLTLPWNGPRVVAAQCLTGGQPEIMQTGSAITIAIPKTRRHAIDTIVKLQFDAEVESLALSQCHRKSLTTGKRATAANWMRGFEPERAVDGKETTAWMPQQLDGQVWLDVDLGKPETFDRMEIHIEDAAPVRGRAYGFTLEGRQSDGSWRRFWQ
ncbi:MAG: DUF5703 domain-containing protein, partial [Kiritimatiellae bacterium]|nr:DUF5703 domain-containing protein [Kiritimatiellia bacterium]